MVRNIVIINLATNKRNKQILNFSASYWNLFGPQN